MSSSRSRSGRRAKSSTTGDDSSRTTKTPRSSAYSAGFEQHLVDHGIYPRNRGPRPSNWEDINNRLGQARPSLSPSRFPEAEFETFQQKNDETLSEPKVRSSILPTIAGNPGIPSEEDIAFFNIAPLTDGTITKPKPDFYDGSRPEQLDRRVREELGPYIVPSAMKNAPMLPNFFAEAKGPQGRTDMARRQACYDGAIGARAMLRARSYASSDGAAYDGNAYTITSTYQSGTGTLTMYTVHPTQPASPGGRPDYHMTQLGAWALTGSHTQFRQGACAFRNARDWAKEQRGNTIARANERANKSQTEASGVDSAGSNLPPSFAGEALSRVSETSVDEELFYTSDAVVHESETSTDDLDLDLNLPAKRPSKHSEQSYRSHRKRHNPNESSSTRRGHIPATASNS